MNSLPVSLIMALSLCVISFILLGLVLYTSLQWDAAYRENAKACQGVSVISWKPLTEWQKSSEHISAHRFLTVYLWIFTLFLYTLPFFFKLIML